MSYEVKYTPKLKNNPTKGRKADPANWTEAAKVERDQYYALLKHRAQAKYRGETHSLTLEEWRKLWQDHWLERGRTPDSLCLVQCDPELGWHLNNVQIMTRREYLQRRRPRRVKNV